MFAFIHIFGALLALLLIPIGILGCVFWIWMLIDAIRNRRLSDGEKVAWVLVILFLHFIGALVYLIFGRSKGATASY